MEYQSFDLLCRLSDFIEVSRIQLNDWMIKNTPQTASIEKKVAMIFQETFNKNIGIVK
jgi:hypothetical protein